MSGGDAGGADKPAGRVPDPWQRLRELTPARIALGRAGSSLPTEEVLRFGLAHARARDAVHTPLDTARLQADLNAAGFASVPVHSRAADRAAYLRRPDWGRRLDDTSRMLLEQLNAAPAALALVIADGLSAVAAQSHAVPLLAALARYVPQLHACPVVVAVQGRVALGDEIGELLDAGQVAVLIGERPGLSSPDSLGIYLTHAPRLGRTDAERNCVSNVRPQGLACAVAARKLAGLIAGAHRLGRSGVDLKEDESLLEGPNMVSLDQPGPRGPG
jgi:ethanolamine ammonia-lyase small subunit